MTTPVMVICILRATRPLVNDPIERDVRTALSMLSRALSDSEPRCSRRVVLENPPPIPAPFSIEIDERAAFQKLIDITGHRRYFSRSILGRRAEHRLAEIGTPCAYLKPNLIPSRDRIHGLDTRTVSTVHIAWARTMPLVQIPVPRVDATMPSGRPPLGLTSAPGGQGLRCRASGSHQDEPRTSIDSQTTTQPRGQDRL